MQPGEDEEGSDELVQLGQWQRRAVASSCAQPNRSPASTAGFPARQESCFPDRAADAPVRELLGQPGAVLAR